MRITGAILLLLAFANLARAQSPEINRIDSNESCGTF